MATTPANALDVRGGFDNKWPPLEGRVDDEPITLEHRRAAANAHRILSATRHSAFARSLRELRGLAEGPSQEDQRFPGGDNLAGEPVSGLSKAEAKLIEMRDNRERLCKAALTPATAERIREAYAKAEGRLAREVAMSRGGGARRLAEADARGESVEGFISSIH